MDQSLPPRCPSGPRERITGRTVLAAWLTAGALAACAGTPQSAPFIAASTASIDAARAAGASELAPVPLDDARAKLQQAQALAQSGRNEDAIRLAQQADVDAQLARARAGAERSRRSAAEVDASLQVLQDELNRRQQPAVQPSQPMPPQPMPPRLPQ